MDKLFTKRINIIEQQESSLDDAIIIFDELIAQKVIRKDCSFYDESWYANDEYHNVGIHFTFDEDSFSKKWKSFLKIDLETLIVELKVYLMTLKGKNVLETFAVIVRDVRKIINSTPNLIESIDESVRIYAPGLVADYFSTLTCENADTLVSAMEKYATKAFDDKSGNQRTLAEFDTYFLFDEIIKDYWAGELSLTERLFYYPLYLWWIITGIMPKRPREFLLTERDCLSTDYTGRHTLRLRYTKNKSHRSKKTYKIDTDYGIQEIQIPDYIAKEIQQYIDLTTEYEPNELGTLFVSDTHYQKLNIPKNKKSRFFSYNNMRTVMSCFYSEIIEGVYGLRTCYRYEQKHLETGDICYIQLGDTRHISLISILQQGGTPAAAMFLAGHENSNSAAHYYSNIETLSYSETYYKYRKIKAGDNKMIISSGLHVPSRAMSVELKDGSRCFSEHYMNKDFRDCINAVGPDGEVGHCPSCDKNRKNGASYFSEEDIYRHSILDDCKELEHAVNLVRRNKGCLEDIGEVVLKLSADRESYAQFLLEREFHNDKEGKTK